MKTTLLSIFLLTCAFSTASPASFLHPGAGVVVQPSRATWNTGYFQEAIVRAGLTELGYEVKAPIELQTPIFYQSVILGDVDYWTNGWFPMQNEHIPDHSADRLERIGFIVKAGGLQGYLVSKKDVERFNIRSLDDFKRPEVKQAFDINGDGKADLVACPPGWGCEKAIAHHLDVYGLREHINPIKAGYPASMAAAYGRYRAGKPVLFFTWAPNWTIFKFKPGKDVMWINVPEIIPRPVEQDAVEHMIGQDIIGAVSNPIKLGFVTADIRIVANRNFLADNPAARRFFEIFFLPLADINAQNYLMEQGEKSREHIEKHARDWISRNQKQWDSWLQQAREAAVRD